MNINKTEEKMHISIRYGNEEGTPIFHLKESISEGRVSPKGKAAQGVLKKEIENFLLINPNKKISVDLRANTDQIIAVGILGNQHWYEYNCDFWSGSTKYKYTWSVDWKQVFKRPLSYESFCERFSISENSLRKKPEYHAHHGWISHNLDLAGIPEKAIPDNYIIDSLSLVRDQNSEIKQYFGSLLRHVLPKSEYEQVMESYNKIQDIMNNAINTGANQNFSNEWEDKLDTRVKKQSRKPKLKNKKKNKDKRFMKKFKKHVELAIKENITGDYAIASYLTKKKIRRKDGKCRWNGSTVKKYRSIVKI
tara:strand:+ start:326 stop:1246 length:921 start_codon:yes stop_codon:yes gene_type:complete